MEFRIPQQLLTDNNTKTKKGEKYGWKTFILYLAPFTQNSKGVNLCSHASKGCAESCLFGSGRGGMSPNVPAGRINKTEYFLADRQLFLNQLAKEITKHSKKFKNLAIRLNGTSDIAWEKLKIKDKDNKSLMELFPKVQFYDYTKNPIRIQNEIPTNYHLTFSRSEENDEVSIELLSKGKNVTIVFDKVPEEYKGYKVVDGDKNDLRFNDEKNVIVGLKYKNMTGKGADNSKAFKSGFAIRVKDIIELQKVA